MAVGLSTTNVANAMLNALRGTSFSAAGTFIALHTGDPGASGTSNPSSNTARQSASFGAASNGVIALSATPTAWTMTATETLSHISVWSASSGGAFLWSAVLSSPRGVASGDTVTLSTCTLQFTPLAS